MVTVPTQTRDSLPTRTQSSSPCAKGMHAAGQINACLHVTGACSNALTGVGAAMASGIHVCSGIARISQPAKPASAQNSAGECVPRRIGPECAARAMVDHQNGPAGRSPRCASSAALWRAGNRSRWCTRSNQAEGAQSTSSSRDKRRRGCAVNSPRSGDEISIDA